MILVTTGTNEQPFDRLVCAAAKLDAGEPLLVQYGSSRVAHGTGEWIDFLPFEELAARAEQASAIICHAGVGSIMLARRSGHRPIVVPRRHHLGEAVDDHQLALARQLSASGLVTLVEDVDELAAAIQAPQAGGTGSAVAGELQGVDALASEIRSVLAGLGCAPLGGRVA